MTTLCTYIEYHALFIFMLNVVMLNAKTDNGIMLNVAGPFKVKNVKIGFNQIV
jgi:hypothetical protein